MYYLEAIVVIIALAVLAAPVASILKLGQRELLIPSMLQAVRWVAVGFVIAVAAEAYLNADFFSIRFLWGTISLAALTVIEYYLLKIERKDQDLRKK